MSSGTHGHATLLSNTNFTTLLNIISIAGPNQTRDSIDISTMDSSAKWREFIPGMLDAGELTFELNYDGAADAGFGGRANTFNAAFTNPASTWTVQFPDASTWACSGFMTALGHAIPFDDKITQSATVKFTGVPTYTDVA